ncbi:hypothetical protein EW145_g6610 [Phellinidium pouzarii]|uniref:Protein kinase domain-containing protein n=1 Tax=Phellinidium pouzarii TaxID=167371 RepID=A0A4S4KW05_9AGAM|nr:hypothetical protein EW145_g6610 [Phellinidium pouzarii]
MQNIEVSQTERAWDSGLLTVRSESKASAARSSPPLFPRQGYSLTTSATQNGDLFLFGGVVDGIKRNDLYSISIRFHTATLIRASGEPPSPRTGHKIVLVGNFLVVFGGDTCSDNSPLPCLDNVLYIFNLVTATWTRLKNNGPTPSGRYCHTMTLDKTRIYVYGGRSLENVSNDGAVNGKEIMLGDLWALDIHSLRGKPSWEYINVLKEPRRAGHVCVPLNDKLYIFGGTYAYASIYETDTHNWSRLTLENPPVSQSQIEHGVSLFGNMACVLYRKRADDDNLDDRLQLLNVADDTWLTLPIGERMHASFSMAFDGSKVILLGWQDTPIIQTLAIEKIIPFTSLGQANSSEPSSKNPESEIVKGLDTRRENTLNRMRGVPLDSVLPDSSASDVRTSTSYSSEDTPVCLEPESELRPESEPGSRSDSECESDWTSEFRAELKISQAERLRDLETQAENDYRRKKTDLDEALRTHKITHSEARAGIAQLYEALEDQRRLIRRQLRKERDKEVERRRNTQQFFLGDSQDTTEVMERFISEQETLSTFQPQDENPWVHSHRIPVLSPSCTPTDSGETDAIYTSDETSLPDGDIEFTPISNGEADVLSTLSVISSPDGNIGFASDRKSDNSLFSTPVHSPKDTLEWLLLQFADLDLTEKLNEEEQMKASGGFADVYFGKLLDGTLVAIKRVRMHLQGDDLITAKIEGIANGLRYLHKEGVVHGDLKAANVVVSPKGVPMLIDFGISHLSQATSTVDMPTSAKKGSFRWMSPELLSPQDDEIDEIHTKESDIWAFGMTGLEVLTKTFPYAKLKNDGQVLRHIAEGKTPEDPDDLQEWNDLDKSLLRFCKECWTRERKDRPAIERLVEKLEAIRIL